LRTCPHEVHDIFLGPVIGYRDICRDKCQPAALQKSNLQPCCRCPRDPCSGWATGTAGRSARAAGVQLGRAGRPHAPRTMTSRRRRRAPSSTCLERRRPRCCWRCAGRGGIDPADACLQECCCWDMPAVSVTGQNSCGLSNSATRAVHSSRVSYRWRAWRAPATHGIKHVVVTAYRVTVLRSISQQHRPRWRIGALSGARCWPQAGPAEAAKLGASYQASRAAEAELERIIEERSGKKLAFPLPSARGPPAAALLSAGTHADPSEHHQRAPDILERPQIKDGAENVDENAAPQVTGIQSDRPPVGEFLRPPRETTEETPSRVPAPGPPPASAPDMPTGGLVSIPGGDTPARAPRPPAAPLARSRLLQPPPARPLRPEAGVLLQRRWRPRRPSCRMSSRRSCRPLTCPSCLRCAALPSRLCRSRAGVHADPTRRRPHAAEHCGCAAVHGRREQARGAGPSAPGDRHQGRPPARGRAPGAGAPDHPGGVAGAAGHELVAGERAHRRKNRRPARTCAALPCHTPRAPTAAALRTCSGRAAPDAASLLQRWSPSCRLWSCPSLKPQGATPSAACSAARLSRPRGLARTAAAPGFRCSEGSAARRRKGQGQGARACQPRGRSVRPEGRPAGRRGRRGRRGCQGRRQQPLQRLLWRRVPQLR